MEKKRYGYGLCVAAFLLSLFFQTKTASANAYIEMEGGYTFGVYGTDFTSHLYRVSTTIGSFVSDFDFAVNIPYLYLVNETGGASESENGIGDVVAQAGYSFFREEDHFVGLYGGVSMKSPTADENKGLGTGSADYGISIGVNRHVGPFQLALSGTYLLFGEAEAAIEDNTFQYSARISRIWDRIGLYAAYEGGRSVLIGGDDLKEVSLGGFTLLNRKYSISAAISLGLSDGSPDMGSSLALTRWF